MTHSSAETMNTTTNYEVKTKLTSYYLGSLKQLGLGNPEGIPCALKEASEAERIDYGNQLLEAIAPVTDLAHYGCIDGRFCVCNADGSAPDVRRRQVGGTGLLVEVGMNADAPVIDTLDIDDDIDAIQDVIQDDYSKKTGVLASAHLGGCGGVNGAVADNEYIHQDDTAINVARALMDNPEVLEYSGLPYNEALGQRVKEEAGKTALLLDAKGWNGQRYVEKTQAEEPAGVEELETDPNDRFNGHDEQAVVFVLGRDGKQSISEAKLKELELGSVFVVNIDASVDMAKAFMGRREHEGATQALIANLAKHAAVAKRLPSDETPVYLLIA